MGQVPSSELTATLPAQRAEAERAPPALPLSLMDRAEVQALQD